MLYIYIYNTSEKPKLAYHGDFKFHVLKTIIRPTTKRLSYLNIQNKITDHSIENHRIETLGHDLYINNYILMKAHINWVY